MEQGGSQRQGWEGGEADHAFCGRARERASRGARAKRPALCSVSSPAPLLIFVRLAPLRAVANSLAAFAASSRCSLSDLSLRRTHALLQETEPLEVCPLPHATLQEVAFTGVLPEGLRRHSRGFLLRPGRKDQAVQTESPDSPRGVADLPGSSSDLQRFRHPELVLAAEGAEEHGSWMSE